MGSGKFIYFSDDVAEKIEKEPNKSRLIMQLLTEHYKKTDYKQMDQKELKKAIEIAKLKRDYETKLKEVNDG